MKLVICQFERPVSEPSPGGGRRDTWDAAVTVYGDLRQAGVPGETEVAGGWSDTVRAHLVIDRAATLAEIDHTYRVKIAGEVWNIRGKDIADLRSPKISFRIERGVST